MTVWLALLPNTQKLIQLELDLLQRRVVVDHLAIPHAEFEKIYETVDGDEAELSVEAAGIEGTVTLHMAKSFKGSWRVREITVGEEGEPAVAWPRPGL